MILDENTAGKLMNMTTCIYLYILYTLCIEHEVGFCGFVPSIIDILANDRKAPLIRPDPLQLPRNDFRYFNG